MSDNRISVDAQVSRRTFLGRAGAVSAAGAVAVGSIGSAAAAVSGKGVSVYKGKYAIDSHRVVDGVFAAPRGKVGLDVIVVVSENGTLDAAAEATARRYAAEGWLAIAPNLPSTYRGASLAGKSAMVDALMRDMPRLKRLARGSGKVAVVAA